MLKKRDKVEKKESIAERRRNKLILAKEVKTQRSVASAPSVIQDR